MRRRQLKWLWARLKQLSAMTLTREELLMKLGAARQKAPAAWRLVDVRLVDATASFSYRAQSRQAAPSTPPRRTLSAAHPSYRRRSRRSWAYYLYVTLARRLSPLAPGLTARSVIEKFAAGADDRPAQFTILICGATN